MNSGSYRLHIRVKKNISLQVGALGTIKFPKGDYFYTGSAMKNLRQRIERHKQKAKPQKWHIDYLLANEFVKIIKIEIFPSETREECEKNREILNLPNSWIPAKEFGSSDCRTCPAHLVGVRV